MGFVIKGLPRPAAGRLVGKGRMTLRTTDTKPCTCPDCGYPFEAATSLDGKVPSAGSVSICWGCGAVNIFAEDCTVRRPTTKEMIDLQRSSTWQTIEQLQRAILTRLSARSGTEGSPPVRGSNPPRNAPAVDQRGSSRSLSRHGGALVAIRGCGLLPLKGRNKLKEYTLWMDDLVTKDGRLELKTVTMERFQSTVRILSNQMFVRWYACLNFPQKPQLLGFQTKPTIPLTSRLAKELFEQGYGYRGETGMWVAERADEGPPAE
jgi:hypothetical protein